MKIIAIGRIVLCAGALAAGLGAFTSPASAAVLDTAEALYKLDFADTGAVADVADIVDSSGNGHHARHEPFSLDPGSPFRGDAIIGDNLNLATSLSRMLPDARHNKAVNVLWMDGHSTSIKTNNVDDPYQELTTYSSTVDNFWDRR